MLLRLVASPGWWFGGKQPVAFTRLFDRDVSRVFSVSTPSLSLKLIFQDVCEMNEK
jgi:hypothetical protein